MGKREKGKGREQEARKERKSERMRECRKETRGKKKIQRKPLIVFIIHDNEFREL